MAKLLKIAAIAEAGFFRAGRHWPKEGVVIGPGDLAEIDMERILAEPNLHVQPVDGDAPAALSDEDLKAALKTAIGNLEAGDFDQKGQPKVEALREAVPEGKDRITAKLRDEVWAEVKPAS